MANPRSSDALVSLVSAESLAPIPPRMGDFQGMAFYWRMIRRHRWPIASFVVAVTFLGTLAVLEMPKQYGATAVLRVDPAAANSMDASSHAAAAPSDALLLTTTESQIVMSPANLLDVARALNLQADPYYIARIGRLKPGESVDDRLLRLLTAEVGVSQPFNTELMQVHVEAHSPQLASDLANGLATAYLKNEYRSRAQALEEASHSMQAQLSDLQAEMERAQGALVRYEAAQDVLDADSKQNIYAARLAQVNDDLGVATNERIQLEAQAQISQSGDLDALSALPAGQPLVPLRNQLLSDQRALAQIATIDGPAHFRYRQQSEIVEHDRSMLAQQQQHTVRQIDSQYQSAVLRERMLKTALDREKTAMDAFNLRSIQYHALKAAADNSSQLYYSLQQHMQDSAVAATLRGSDLRVVSAARPESKPTGPHPLEDGVLLFLLSLALGVGTAISYGFLDQSLSSPDQVQHWIGLPVLALLPETLNAAVQLRTRLFLDCDHAESNPDAKLSQSGYVEAVHSLFSALSFSVQASPRILAVVSALPGEGKSTLAANLAVTCAALDGDTLLIDADLRKPSSHRLFEISSNLGLTSILRDRCTFEQALVPLTSTLSVLPGGPPVANPSELMHLHLDALLENLPPRFRNIIIDSPPVLGFSDASLVARLAQATILVIAAGRTARTAVSEARRQLQSVGVSVAGVALNRVSVDLDPSYSYYYSQYAYEEAAPE